MRWTIMFGMKKIPKINEFTEIAKIIDYAPSMLTIYDYEGNVLASEPSLVAIAPRENKIVQFGHMVQEERQLLEQEGCVIGSPLNNGAVADYALAYHFIKHIYTTYCKRSLLRKPKIDWCIPATWTEDEYEAFDAIYKLLTGTEYTSLYEITYLVYTVMRQEVDEKHGYSSRSPLNYVIEITPAP